MALKKQLCCFGVVLVLLWMGTFSSAQIWKPNGNPQRWRPSPGIGQGVTYTPQQNPGPWPQKPPVRVSPPKVKDPTIPGNLCEVEDDVRVPCGLPGTTPADCQDIGCCSDGAQCFYGKTVTLHCTLDAQFVIVISKDVTVPRLNMETVTLLGGSGDPSCVPVDSNFGFAIYQFTATSCGTTLREENDYLIYENQMSSSYEVGMGELGFITRDSQFKLGVQCRYYGLSAEALLIQVNPVLPPPPVSAPGPLRVELRLANGECTSKGCVEEVVAYTSYYDANDYPVSKVLREPVYVEVRILERTDPNIFLTLSRCWTTTTSDPDTLPQWDLLIDGSPSTDDRYLTTLVPISPDVEFPNHYKRFILKMFTFVDQQFLTPMQETSVFIHCKASVCNPTEKGSCPIRFRRDVNAAQQEEAKETVVVSSGKLIIKT